MPDNGLQIRLASDPVDRVARSHGLRVRGDRSGGHLQERPGDRSDRQRAAAAQARDRDDRCQTVDDRGRTAGF